MRPAASAAATAAVSVAPDVSPEGPSTVPSKMVPTVTFLVVPVPAIDVSDTSTMGSTSVSAGVARAV